MLIPCCSNSLGQMCWPRLNVPLSPDLQPVFLTSRPLSTHASTSCKHTYPLSYCMCLSPCRYLGLAIDAGTVAVSIFPVCYIEKEHGHIPLLRTNEFIKSAHEREKFGHCQTNAGCNLLLHVMSPFEGRCRGNLWLMRVLTIKDMTTLHIRWYTCHDVRCL